MKELTINSFTIPDAPDDMTVDQAYNMMVEAWSQYTKKTTAEVVREKILDELMMMETYDFHVTDPLLNFIRNIKLDAVAKPKSSKSKKKLSYLSPHYFDEIVYRIENDYNAVKIGVDDPEKWLSEFKKHRPAISSIKLTHIRGNIYEVSADI
jgi:hypothetical protein